MSSNLTLEGMRTYLIVHGSQRLAACVLMNRLSETQIRAAHAEMMKAKGGGEQI
jgi:hypothetical protein